MAKRSVCFLRSHHSFRITWNEMGTIIFKRLCTVRRKNPIYNSVSSFFLRERGWNLSCVLLENILQGGITFSVSTGRPWQKCLYASSLNLTFNSSCVSFLCCQKNIICAFRSIELQNLDKNGKNVITLCKILQKKFFLSSLEVVFAIIERE